MDQLTKILESVKERLANPFIFSFIVSWLLYNWEIPVGLLWYDLAQMKKEGADTVFDFIRLKACHWQGPIWIALGYTFLYPFGKSFITIIQSAALALGNKVSFKITKESPVSVAMYMKLRENLKKKEDQVSDLISKENDRISEKIKLEQELIDKQKELEGVLAQSNALRDKGVEREQEIKQMEDAQILEGTWTMIVTNALDHTTSEIIEIRHGQATLTTFGKDRKNIFQIRNFFYSPSRKTINFLKVSLEGVSTLTAFNELQIENNKLVGKEYMFNGNRTITYKRGLGDLKTLSE